MNTTSPSAAPPLADIPDLATFVARAWDLHAQQPAAVVAGLRARAPQLPADDDGAGAVGLAEHVWLAHLGDPAGLDGWLDALPAAWASGGAAGDALRRARWAASAAGGGQAAADSPLSDALRWRALQNVWAVWSRRGRAAAAKVQLEAEWPAALAHPDAAATRALAATCNNTAVELRSGTRGDAERDALMLAAARASARLWTAVGTWVHAERAEYQLARCHAVLGDGAQALVHARACQAAVEAHADDPQADAFERFYVHEALAWSHLAAGDRAAAAGECDRMQMLLAQVADPELRAWAAADRQALETALG